jgi:histidinol-phosphate aminotransferase
VRKPLTTYPLFPEIAQHFTETRFLVDEAFIGLAGDSVAHWVPNHPNLLVTRTLSKAHSLAGFRVGYAVLPEHLAHDLNSQNDAYPLARPSQAAALATLRHKDRIRTRVKQLRAWTEDLAAELRALGVRTIRRRCISSSPTSPRMTQPSSPTNSVTTAFFYQTFE